MDDDPLAEAGFAERRAGLLARYGKPSSYDIAAGLALVGSDAHPSVCVAFRYSSREEAQAWAQLNADHHGHVSAGIAAHPAGIGVVGVTRLNMTRANMIPRGFQDGAGPPDSAANRQAAL